MTIREAVSIILIYKNEVFVIERQNYLASFPGYTAFPGGKIDEEDYTSTENNYSIMPAHYNALVREAQEELQVDLSDTNLVKSIKYLAEATSPEFNPRRFKTYFFRVELNQKLNFEFDQGEFKFANWYLPKIVLDQWKEGQRLCVPPVWKILEKLVESIDTFEVSFSKRYDLKFEVPHSEAIHGLWQVMPLSDTIPPADRTNCFIFGDNEKIIVDPSPKDSKELDKFLYTLRDVQIGRIFLTHHHPDHHQNLPLLLERTNAKLFLSKDTFQRIQTKWGKDYFCMASSIEFVKEGDEIGVWLGKSVRCYEVPGHDEGQIALAPETLEWFIAGDLFQGIGTVVVGGDEGNMQKYFATLERVIALSPKCVMPSHGIALGGTNIIEKTLEHRKFRENQIFEMHKKGLSIDQILSAIYFDIPEKVLKYARANIHSHLDKLITENRI